MNIESIILGFMLGLIAMICYNEIFRERKLKNAAKEVSNKIDEDNIDELDLISPAKENIIVYPKKTGVEAAKQLSETIKLSSNRRHVMFEFNSNEKVFSGIAEYVNEHQNDLERLGYKVTYSTLSNYRHSDEHLTEDTMVELDW